MSVLTGALRHLDRCGAPASSSAGRAGRRLALAGGLLAAMSTLFAPSAYAVKKGQHFQDWTVGCEKPPSEKTDRCFIYQTVVNKKSNQPVLQMAVGYLPGKTKNDDRPAALLTLPLGVALPPGVGFKIDDGKMMRLQFERCVPTGCIAGFPLDNGMLDKLKKGLKVEVRVSDGQQVVTLPISLKGFTAGFEALEK